MAYRIKISAQEINYLGLWRCPAWRDELKNPGEGMPDITIALSL